MEIIIPYLLISILFTILGNKKSISQPFKYKEIMDKYNMFLSCESEYLWWQQRDKETFWKTLTGRQFEIEIAKLFEGLGYKAEICKQGGDNGIDIILSKNNEKIAVQCKQHKNAISPAVARDLYGTMLHFNINKGMLIVTNGFTSGTLNFCGNKDIECISIDKILKLQEQVKNN
jgi:restriction system protein